MMTRRIDKHSICHAFQPNEYPQHITHNTARQLFDNNHVAMPYLRIPRPPATLKQRLRILQALHSIYMTSTGNFNIFPDAVVAHFQAMAEFDCLYTAGYGKEQALNQSRFVCAGGDNKKMPREFYRRSKELPVISGTPDQGRREYTEGSDS